MQGERGERGELGKLGKLGEMGKLGDKISIAYYPVPYSLTNDIRQMTNNEGK
ncbi:hypothetical protein MC7420_1987 [Coleofasciculus chthonoplastes PCC 7420]|uniref:Uncharacterized protein n=1 Tax=Coleofasciculus chthonoplastes PCC 7420 TaxID=118168 RepID=B4VMJ3_9CYAN|nr:hypothetical protein MC7420_1987 [Coleofasciculus chthonoplastes PCC 7420]